MENATSNASDQLVLEWDSQILAGDGGTKCDHPLATEPEIIDSPRELISIKAEDNTLGKDTIGKEVLQSIGSVHHKSKINSNKIGYNNTPLGSKDKTPQSLDITSHKYALGKYPSIK